MNLVEEYIDDNDLVKIKRTWQCCNETWVKDIKPNNSDEVSWTPVCPKCGGFDGTFFI